MILPWETNNNAKDWLAEKPLKFAIVQFEGRSPWEVQHIGANVIKYIPTLWDIGSTYNYLYAQRHQHNCILYHWGQKGVGCISTKNQTLAEAWGKIRAMMQVHEDQGCKFMKIKDAIVDHKFHVQPLQQLFHKMITWLPGWHIKTRPFVFNQEGPFLWCGQIEGSNYSHCINISNLLWMRSEISTKVMKEWWRLADNPYGYKQPSGLQIPRSIFLGSD